VDDSIPIRKMAAMVLGKAGHHVTVAAHGQEAVHLLLPETRKEGKEAVHSAPFDVVLMDIQMPVMDGLTATSLYRQQEEAKLSLNQRLLIIGMSACSDDTMATQAHEAGMDFFMPKPFSIHHFLDILHEAEEPTKSSVFCL